MSRRRTSLLSTLARRSLLVLAGILAPTLVAAQQPPRPSAIAARERLRHADSTATHRIKLRDGSMVMGRVVALRHDTVDVVSSVGPLAVPLENVERADVVAPEDFHDGEYWFPNPNRSRLLFAPTGRMLKRGAGYFSDHMLFFPGFAVGVSDRVTVGGGMSVVPGLSVGEQIFYFTPKVGVVSARNVDVAVGLLALKAPEEGASFGVAYGVTTIGAARGGLTAGLGFGYIGGTMSNRPVVMLGGDVRLSPRVGLVSENYAVPGSMNGVVGSAAMRFFGEKLSVDLGVVRPFGDGEEGMFLPFVGFVVNF